MALIEINADWKQVVDSKGFRLAVVLALALIGSVLMVFGSLDVDGWKKFTPYTKPVWPLELTGGFVIFLAAIMAIRRNRVTQEKGREKYLEEVIRQVENSTRRVSMCMTRLDRSTINESISKLQAILAKKASGNINVRLIAPTAPEFVAASEELRGKGIPLRHLRLFDSSFATFDSSITVFPTKSDPRIGTVEARTIPSTDVAEALEELIEKWWWRYDALPGADFVRLTVKGILEHQNDRPLGVIAKDLGGRIVFFRHRRGTFGTRDSEPGWYFRSHPQPLANRGSGVRIPSCYKRLRKPSMRIDESRL